MLTVTHEEVEQFNRCPRRWAWGSAGGMGLGFYRRPSHKAFCAEAIKMYLYGESDDPLTTALNFFEQRMSTDASDEDYQADLAIGKCVIQNFALWYSSLYNGFDCEPYEHLGVVQPLFPKSPIVIESTEDGYVIFRSEPDDSHEYLLKVIVTTEKSETWRQRLTRGDEEMNLALALHREAGNKFDGVMYLVVRFKAPAIPERLKSGGLTKRANIDTTAQVYRQAIRESGLNEADYAEILSILDMKGNTFIDMVFYTPTEAQTDAALSRARMASELLGHPGWESIARPYDPSWCARCPFVDACLAFDRHEDYKFFLGQNKNNKDINLMIDWSTFDVSSFGK